MALVLISQNRHAAAWRIVRALLKIAPRDADLLRWSAWLAAANREYAASMRTAQQAAALLPATIEGRGDALTLGRLAGFVESLDAGGLAAIELRRHDQAIQAALPPALVEAYRQGRREVLAAVDQQRAVLARMEQQAEDAVAVERQQTLVQLDQQRNELQRRITELQQRQELFEQQAAATVQDLQTQDAILASQSEQVYWDTQNALYDLSWLYGGAWSPWDWGPRWLDGPWRPFRRNLFPAGWTILGFELNANLNALLNQADWLAWQRNQVAAGQITTLSRLQWERRRLQSELRRLDNVRRRNSSQTLQAQRRTPPGAASLSRKAFISSLSAQAPLNEAAERQRLLRRFGARPERPPNPVEF